MTWIYKKLKDLQVGDKFVFDEEQFFWHWYYTVMKITDDEILLEDLSHFQPGGSCSQSCYWKMRVKKSKKGWDKQVIIRPDAPLHIRKECYPYCHEYLNWPYDYPNKKETEQAIRDAMSQ